MFHEILKKHRKTAEPKVNKELSSVAVPNKAKSESDLNKEDIPERLINAPVSLVDKQANLKVIQAFIADRVADPKKRESFEKVVNSILTMHLEGLLDYPYIASYRREKFYPVLNLDQMWCVAFLEKEAEDIILLQQEIKQLLQYFAHLEEQQTEQIERFTRQSTSMTQLKLVKRSLEQTKESNLLPLFLQFSINSFEFSHNLHSTDRIRPPSPKIKPPVAAKPFVSVEYNSIQAVLREVTVEGAKYFARNPIIVSHFTDLVFPCTTVTAKPTFKGKKELDPLDKHFYLSLVENKPVNSFRHTEFLFLCRMEARELVELEFSVSIIDLKEVSLDFEYCSVVSSSDEYHSLRIETAKKLVDLLLPESYTQISEILREKAESVASLQAALNFYSILKRGRLKGIQNGIVALYYCSIANRASFSFLDENQNVIAQNTFEYLALSRETLEFKEEKAKFDAELNYLLSVIANNEVDYIIVGANHIKAKKLKELVTFELSPKFKERVIFSYCDVVNLLFFSENIETKTVEEQSLNLALYQFCPLESTLLLFDSEYSRNFTLYLDIHELIFFLNKRRLSKMLELAAVRAVNEEGVDIEKITDPGYANIFRFLSGIGPRKAEILKTNKNLVTSRTNLNAVLGENVAFSLAPFLILKKSNIVFDSTRIPPEMYDLAKDIHFYSKELDSKAEKGIAKENKKIALKSKLPAILNHELNFIATELNDPFGNKSIYCYPKGHSLLEFLAVVPQKSVFKGAVISGTLLEKGSSEAIVMVSEGLKGFLASEEIPYLEKGETVKAFISSISLDKMELKLTTDPSFSTNLIYHKLSKAEQIRKFKFNHRVLLKGQNAYLIREITSKYFFNFDFDRSRKYLLSQKENCFLFRPVRGRDDALYLTLRVNNKVVFDFPILECDKKSHLLGKKLLLGGESYSSLDEIKNKAVPNILKWIQEVKKHANYTEKENLEAFKKAFAVNQKQFFSFKLGFLNEVSEGIVLAWSRRGEEVEVCKISISPHTLFLGGTRFSSLKEAIGLVRNKFEDKIFKESVRKELNLIQTNCLKTPEGKEELTFKELEQLDSKFEGERLTLEKKRTFKEDSAELLKRKEKAKNCDDSKYKGFLEEEVKIKSATEKEEIVEHSPNFSDIEEDSKPKKPIRVDENDGSKLKSKEKSNNLDAKQSISPWIERAKITTPPAKPRNIPQTIDKSRQIPNLTPEKTNLPLNKPVYKVISTNYEKYNSLIKNPLQNSHALSNSFSFGNNSHYASPNYRNSFSPQKSTMLSTFSYQTMRNLKGSPCSKCKEFGHNANICKNEVVCYYCNQPGHIKRHCPQGHWNRSKGAFCNRCLEYGHDSFYCTRRPVCFHCKKEGHVKKHCWLFKKQSQSPRK